MDWPSVQHPALGALLEAFKSRSKALHYRGPLCVARGVGDNGEWLQVRFFPAGLPPSPYLERTVWQDLVAALLVKSARKKTHDKEVAWNTGLRLACDAATIVATFEATIGDVALGRFKEALTRWSALEAAGPET
jgi:hypothetical protein